MIFSLTVQNCIITETYIDIGKYRGDLVTRTVVGNRKQPVEDRNKINHRTCNQII